MAILINRVIEGIPKMLIKSDHGRGSGSALNPTILIFAGISAVLATLLASMSIVLQLKNYRKPLLQRQVVRIMLMIPIYALSSYVSLFSLEAAVFIDAIRDVYEAFVIYNFFHLLLDYLGGERSLLILLHGRPPKYHTFPVSLFKRELDASDPFTFLFLKRGILQYVQVKPILAAVTLTLKATGQYGEGDFRSDKGYLYVSIVYNISICVALYCLAMFWMVINDDVKPFRPMPKFLCIKGILFFCFWQGIGISLLVKMGVLTHVGPYTDSEHISLAISDTLICFEMPFFAIAHMFAFSHTDYIDRGIQYAARMPFIYAARDAFGLLDVVEDSRATLRGGVSYKRFEPVEGGMHIGSGRDRRIRAGLRYAKGGKQKYWLPMPREDELIAPTTGPLQAVRKRWDEEQHGYAPLLGHQVDEVVHEGGPSTPRNAFHEPFKPDYIADDDDNLSLDFGEVEETEDMIYEESRRLMFGDYNYPVIDVSSEAARIRMWDEEERILRDERAAAFAWKGLAGTRGSVAYQTKRDGYGATSHGPIGGKPLETKPLTSHPAIIDYDQETVPDIDIKGIRLKWTKGAVSPEQNTGGTPRRAPLTGYSSSGSAGSSSSRPHRGTPLQPEHVSDPNTPEDEEMPPDAVDLVVEDQEAAQIEMEQERRRGEPGLEVGTGIKKVYRRKYRDDSGTPQREIEIEEEREVGENPNDLPQKAKIRVKDEGAQYTPRSSQDTFPPSPWGENNRSGLLSPSKDRTDVIIARETTPPPHARVEVNQYRTPSNDNNNPWA